MRRPLVMLGLGALLAACGEPTRRPPDAAVGIDVPVTPPDAPPDVAPDAPACMTFVPSTETASNVLSFTFVGGAHESFGCAPIDPTYWMSGAGMSATVTFAAPQTNPSIRVWGMNTDDTASIKVNGAAYTLDATSASLSTKVVCGLSPGPDGMEFVSGTLTGANTPGEGNYSYQDVTIQQTGVTSIQISGLTGAGWGFAGASAAGACPIQ